MKSSDIQAGTALFFPNALDGKVQEYNVEEIRNDKDDEKQRILWIANAKGERFYVTLWNPLDTKASDHCELFVPYAKEFGYGGWLIFYYTERAAASMLSLVKQAK